MKLKDGMGDKLSIVANLMGTAIICLAQAFPLGWELTLACCTVVPFSIGASIILTNVSHHNSQLHHSKQIETRCPTFSHNYVI